MPSSTASAAAVPLRRRGGLAGLGLACCLLAVPAWAWTLDVPWLRSSGATAWLLLGAGALLGVLAARADRRVWVRLLAGIEVALLALFAWLYLVFARLPASDAPALARVPDAAAALALESTAGGSFQLDAELARRPLHLVFFRGPW